MRNYAPLFAGAAFLAILWLSLVVLQQRKLIAEQREKIDELAWTLKDGTAVPPVTVAGPQAVASAAASGGIDMAGVKNDADKTGATVRGVTTSTATTPGDARRGLPSTEETPRPTPSAPLVPTPAPSSCPKLEEPAVMRATQHLRLDEPVGGEKQAPWGRVSFSAWEPKPWSLDVYPRAYQATTVITTNDDGVMRAYTKLRLRVQDETIDLPVTSGETVSTRPEAKFRFSPAVYLGLDGGFSVKSWAATAAPTVQLGLFSFGQTKLAPDYAFLLVGLGYASSLGVPMFTVSPVSVNVGAFLPVIDNLHLVPTFGLSRDGDMMALAGVRAKF